MRRRLLVFFLAAALLGCGCAASAAGGADDPLVSLDYAQSWAEGLVEEAAEAARAAFDEAFGDAEAVPASGSRQVRLSAGQAVRLREGASVTLTSGSARVALNAGALVNATVGGEAVTGKLNARQLYIACENCDATITASAASTLDISGGYETVHTQLSFTDVPQNAWFYSYVYDAVELGLVDGMDAKTFAPDGSFTVANFNKLFEANTIAAFGTSILVSVASAVIGAIVGALASYALVIGSKPNGLLRRMISAISSVLAQFGGVMLAFALVILSGMFMESTLLSDSSRLWDLLEIGLGGYVIGRSGEKVTDCLLSRKWK